MQDKVASYPLHPEFEELLNSCGSMTKQLESLGQRLSIQLIHEGVSHDQFQRFVTLNLNQVPVVAAFSCSKLSDTFFSQLLKNSNNIPIGKFLFTQQSQVQRLSNMQIEQLSVAQVAPLRLQEILLACSYAPDQQLWQRTSIFTYANEQLKLLEIMLPELESFY